MATGPIARALRAFLIAAALAVAAGPAAPQSEPPPSQGQSPAAGAGTAAAPQVDPEALKALIATLEDPQARESFLNKLRALLEAQDAAPPEAEPAPVPGLGTRALDILSTHLERFSDQLSRAAAVAADVPAWLDALAEEFSDPERRDRWIEVLWHVALVIAAGLVAEWLARLVLRRPHNTVETRAADSMVVRALFLTARTVLDILPIVAFAAASYAVLPWLEPDRTIRLVLLAVIYANVLSRAVMAVVRMVLAPRATSLRLFPIGDETAAYLFEWAWRVTNVAVYGYFAAEIALMLGLEPAAHAILVDLVGLLLTLLAIVFILQVRRPVRDWLRGRSVSRLGLGTLRARMADIWHVLAIAYVLGCFAVWVIEIEGGFAFLLRATVLTLAAIAVAALATRAVRRGSDRLFAVSGDLDARFPGLQQRANRYLPVLQRALYAAIGVIAGLAVLQVWGLDVLRWLATETGRGALGSLTTIVIVLVLAVATWELLSSAIERYLTRVEGEHGRSQRLHTLLPLARKVIFIAMLVFVTLIVLSELGVDIAPLLAGAGVVGLAIGFGAQTLVKDIITGLFILVEDAVSVGNVAQLGGHTGVVEAISLRTVQLRDLEGRVFTIPFSDVTTVINYTKDYSYAFMEIGVAYRENVDEVIEVLKSLAEEMRADEAWAPSILDELEVLGLDRFGDSAVIIRVRFRTVPGDQWKVRREYFRRMKARFDDLNIEIPFPHVTLYMGEDKEGKAPPVAVRQLGDAAVADESQHGRTGPTEGRSSD